MPEHAGNARLALFVADRDALVAGTAGQGINAVLRETYDNRVRNITYRDGEENKVGLTLL